MLDRSELAASIMAVLLGAIVLGWVLHWLWHRLSGAYRAEVSRISELAGRLQEAEAAETEAHEAAAEIESRLALREAETEAEIAELQERLDSVVAARDAELASQLREARAELQATMDGLGFARTRIAELEAEIEELKT